MGSIKNDHSIITNQDVKRDYWIGRTAFKNPIKRTPRTFRQLITGCYKPLRANITLNQYKELPKEEQKHIKNCPYIMPGSYSTPEDTTERKTTSIRWIELLAIDIDNPEDANRLFDPLYLEIYLENHGINYLAYPTFSSTTQFKRIRLLVDAHKLPVYDYARGVATVCHWLKVKPTRESLVPNQLMYLPHICKDADWEVYYWADGREFRTSDCDSAAHHITYKNPIAHAVSGDIDENYEPPLVMEEPTFIDALMHVSPDMAYPDWVRVACGVKHYFAHDDARGLEVFDQWSQKDDCNLYTGYSDCKKLWDALKAHTVGRPPITGRYILDLAKDEGWEQKVFSRAEQAEIELGPTPVFPEKIKYLVENYAYLARDNRYINIGEKSTNPITEKTLSHYHLKHCYSTADLTAKNKLSKRSPTPKVKPHIWIEHMGQHKFESTMYCPGSPYICEYNGNRYVNTWRRPELHPAKAETQVHVSQILDVFFKWILEDDLKRQTFLTILRHLVEHPGQRLRFCPVLQGAQGIGKTWLRSFMGAIIGSHNVQSITTTAIQDNLTDWAGRCEITFVEEIYIHGKKRYETIEHFKQYISNPEISIRIAYQGMRDVVNPTSYIALTNHKDAIPVDLMHDRRYWVVYSSIQQRQQVYDQDKAYGGKNKFFTSLWSVLTDPAACKHWLLEQQPVPNFDPAIMPDTTDDMAYMAMLSKHPVEEGIEDILHAKPRGIYLHVISSKVIEDLLTLEGFSKRECRPTISKVLQKKWHRCTLAERAYIDGDRHTVWHDGTVGSTRDAVALWKKYFTGELKEDESNIIPFDRGSDED